MHERSNHFSSYPCSDDPMTTQSFPTEGRQSPPESIKRLKNYLRANKDPMECHMQDHA